MTQAEFKSAATGATQNERILNRLRQCFGKDVPMPELAKAATSTGIGVAVHSRINDLRQAGYKIIQSSERHKGQVHSFYRLVGEPGTFNTELRMPNSQVNGDKDQIS